MIIVKNFTVKLSDDLLRRLIYISAAEKRTPNNHIIYMLRQNIAYYERVHGKIPEAELRKLELPTDERSDND